MSAAASTTPAFRFPKGFVWGTATAAPQIEGAATADGKGPSIWDVFSRKKGAIAEGDTLDEACDHFHRYKGDVALMRSLGIRHYRFSIAWPRIYPSGDGALNPKGLDFYNKLINELLSAGITPWVTMFHWDLPQALEERGGWRERVVIDAFARYADTIVKAFGDRVKHWITLNEIRCFTEHGYGGMDKAPGRNDGPKAVNQTIHHALVCHGHAVRAVREFGGRGARCGLTDNCESVIPVTESKTDIDAARAAFIQGNLPILDPLYRGHYAPEYLKACGKNRPKVAKEDFSLISLPTDFLGINLYSALFVRAGRNGKPERVLTPAHYPRADSAWLKLAPRALYWSPRFISEVFKEKNIYITENGCGYDDDVVAGGEVLDLHRVEYLRSYLRELNRCIEDGTPVKGYFLWSLLDNFEWSDGYKRRFGITHVDFATKKRTPKLSARWYRDVIAANAVL